MNFLTALETKSNLGDSANAGNAHNGFQMAALWCFVSAQPADIVTLIIFFGLCEQMTADN